MRRFTHAHASHRDWHVAVDEALAQLDGRVLAEAAAAPPALGLVYVTQAWSGRLGAIRELLAARAPHVRWVGAAAPGICAAGVEYIDTPAIALMVCTLRAADFRIFSGLAPLLGQSEHFASALVHADPGTPDLAELLVDLSLRTRSGRLFGGVIEGSVDGEFQAPTQLADAPVGGGVSGVAFGPAVRLLSRVTQGCAPLAGEHVISSCESHYIRTLDGRPALDVMLDDLDVPAHARGSRNGDAILRALPADRLAHGLMIGLTPADAPRQPGFGFGDYLVRNVIGIDPENRLLAVAARPQPGDRVVFCTRDREAARADLIRICTELREEIETDSLQVLGAHYVSCVGRGPNLFGAMSAELQSIAHNLGDLPLVGFFANGEIAGDQLYGYTGVLTLFVTPSERSPAG
jgi:small ligand-binding sensory domain FIST